MPIPFKTWYYIYPPRPTGECKFQSDGYKQIQQLPGWIAQPKLKGQRNLICISPDQKVELWSRHNRGHHNYSISRQLAEEILATVKYQKGEWTVLDSELIHAKVKDGQIKNTIYIWDVLVHNGMYLLGTTYAERYQLVYDILGVREAPVQEFYREASQHLWMAISLDPGQWDQWWAEHVVGSDYIEGYVIKNVNTKLAAGVSEKNNDSWNLRCRKAFSSGPTGNRTPPAR